MKKVDHGTSKRFKHVSEKVDPEKVYTIEEAIKLAKETSTVKFDAGIELHAHLNIDPKKSEQQIRTTATLPHGSGKSVKIAVCTADNEQQKAAKKAGADIVGEKELIDDIKAGKVTFDVLVATPDSMKLLGPVAKILGPKGLMPNPKDGTVTTNVAGIVDELKKGRVAYKNDASRNIHTVFGKVSFTDEQLKENFDELIASINKAKPITLKGTLIKTMSICSSMGPGIKVKM